MANYSLDRLSSCKFVNNGVYENSNFTQKFPHTAIGTGFTGLTFRDCNLVNCDVPADATVESCNTTQISRCGHLHEGYECVTECEHMVSKEDVSVDGVVIDTIYEYADKVVA